MSTAADDVAPGVPIPALLRHARGAFSRAILDELHEGGFEDLPRNGPYVLGGMANQQVTAAQSEVCDGASSS